VGRSRCAETTRLPRRKKSKCETIMAQWDRTRLEPLIKQLSAVRTAMLQLADEGHEQVERLHESYRRSAINLLHYLAFRRHVVRPRQEQLAALGVSSLGRAEAHVLTTFDAVLRILLHMAESTDEFPPCGNTPVSISDGRQLLRTHSEALVGPHPA